MDLNNFNCCMLAISTGVPCASHYKSQITACSSGLVFVPAMQILSRYISFVSRIIIWNNKIQVDRLFLAEAMGNESGI